MATGRAGNSPHCPSPLPVRSGSATGAAAGGGGGLAADGGGFDWRRRCSRAKCSTASMSSASIHSPPRQAAWARAARSQTRSARRPSTAASKQRRAMLSSAASSRGIRASRRRASAQRRRRVSCWPSQRSTKACGSASKASRRRMISARSAGGGWVSRRTLRPKRSSSCGRSSPSSGFIVPISTKRAGCRWEMPSRSTRLTPLAATSSNKSTRWSGSRLTSST